ncbi:MAG: response regulator transcription factor [Microgenomates group bacterium]
MKILLVEDDPLIADNLKILLERQTYVVVLAANVEDGIEKVLEDEFDMVICDRRLPDGDGMDIVKIARSNGLSVVTLMLTAKNKATDIIEGLDAGADDYLPKPFDGTVLLARVRALLRRRKKVVASPVLTIGNVTIDSNTREVKVKNKLVTLSPKEYGVLEYLLANRGKIVERIDILTHVWNEEVDLFSNTVDVHIRYLRQKLGNTFIQTVRGKGYVIWDK